MAANNDAGDTILRLVSEFAAVEVGRDDRGNGPRLMIRDTQSGRCVFLDPLELAALAWMRHEDRCRSWTRAVRAARPGAAGRLIDDPEE